MGPFARAMPVGTSPLASTLRVRRTPSRASPVPRAAFSSYLARVATPAIASREMSNSSQKRFVVTTIVVPIRNAAKAPLASSNRLRCAATASTPTASTWTAPSGLARGSTMFGR